MSSGIEDFCVIFKVVRDSILQSFNLEKGLAFQVSESILN